MPYGPPPYQPRRLIPLHAKVRNITNQTKSRKKTGPQPKPHPHGLYAQYGTAGGAGALASAELIASPCATPALYESTPTTAARNTADTSATNLNRLSMCSTSC